MQLNAIANSYSMVHYSYYNYNIDVWLPENGKDLPLAKAVVKRLTNNFAQLIISFTPINKHLIPEKSLEAEEHATAYA